MAALLDASDGPRTIKSGPRLTFDSPPTGLRSAVIRVSCRVSYVWGVVTMTDTAPMTDAASGAFEPTDPGFDPMDLDRLAASLEALALTFRNFHPSARRGEHQHVDGVALAA